MKTRYDVALGKKPAKIFKGITNPDTLYPHETGLYPLCLRDGYRGYLDIRISEALYNRLANISTRSNRSLEQTIEMLVDSYSFSVCGPYDFQ